ncbi:MAG TPA: hypothetical protein VFF60_12515 [Candidatus Binatus sp.]|nr:hypothetical protein [Candidatus Binatus sp.]
MHSFLTAILRVGAWILANFVIWNLVGAISPDFVYGFANDMGDARSTSFNAGMLAGLVSLAFLPSYIGFAWKRPRKWWILALNFVPFVGWIVAMILTCYVPKHERQSSEVKTLPTG